MQNDCIAMSDAWRKLYDDLKAIDRESNERVLAGDGMESKRKAAVATLEHRGFTWHGGDLWKPPLGLPPEFVSNDRAELQEYRKAAATKQVPFMYGIEDPDGNAYLDENCVGRTVSDIDDTLMCLNDGLDDDQFPYVIVPLYRCEHPAPAGMKDHQIRELVTELRDIAIAYHDTQQLRERIARAVRTAMVQVEAEPVQYVTRIECDLSLVYVEKLAASIRELNGKRSDPQLVVVEPEIQLKLPDGWVPVPIEPTAEMYDAGDRQLATKQVWDAMIAAAPQQEVKRG
jgi:hypothetical protein